MDNFKTLPFQVNQRIVDLCKADSERHDRHQAEKDAAHKELWDAVHAEYPELDREGNFTMKCEYVDQGIVMLDTAKSCTDPKHALGRLLGRMIKDIN